MGLFKKKKKEEKTRNKNEIKNNDKNSNVNSVTQNANVESIRQSNMPVNQGASLNNVSNNANAQTQSSRSLQNQTNMTVSTPTKADPNNTTQNPASNNIPNTQTQNSESLKQESKTESKTVTPKIENTEVPNKSEEVEVLNLEDKKEKLKTTIEKKREFRFLLFLFGTVILFVVLMPIFRNIVKPSSKIQINNNEEYVEESGNLEHGYLVINKDSFKRVENIKFYEFKKYENNKIVFSYAADKTVRNASKLNIYVEIVDNTGQILNKTLFDVTERLKKESIHSYSIDLSSSSYDSAYYVKLEVIEPTNYTKTLVCSKEEKNDKISSSNEITYTFIDNMLKSYEYNQSFEVISSEMDSKEYTDRYANLYNTFKGTNIKEEDISYSDNEIYYKIDFSYFDLGEIEFKTRYNENDYYDMIVKLERAKGWSCE